METQTWSPTENQFDNGTKNSKKKMNIISSDHDSKLHAQISNPLIAVLFSFFHAIRLMYLAKYTQWKSTVAAYHGATVNFEQLIAQLSSTMIEDFDIRIQVLFKRGTAQYAALLPNFRIPFQSGEYDERITALGTLSESLTGIVALAAVKTDVDAFLLQLTTARDQQQGLEGLKQTLSEEVELARVTIAQAMYYTLGGLMQIFSANSIQIANFYDLETLRGSISDTADLIFDGIIGSGQIVNVLNPTVTQYVAGVTLRIKNTTTGPAIGGLYFYTAMSPTDGWSGIGQNLNPGQEATIILTAAEFRAYFNVQNQGPNQQSFEVEIM